MPDRTLAERQSRDMQTPNADCRPDAAVVSRSQCISPTGYRHRLPWIAARGEIHVGLYACHRHGRVTKNDGEGALDRDLDIMCAAFGDLRNIVKAIHGVLPD